MKENTRYTASVLIPTYNRPDDLRACVASICAQSQLPAEVVVIDDGNLQTSVLNELAEMLRSIAIAFVYYKKDHAKERRGLSESKNIGLGLVHHPICFIFDDDVVLEPQYVEASLRVWEERDSEQLVAVGGVITNSRRKTLVEKLYNRLFGLVGRAPWDVTNTGFQVWDDSVTTTTQAWYAHGGVCSLHVARAKQFPFPVFAGGRTALEDVAFFAAAKRAGMHAYIEPKSRLQHNESPAAREAAYAVGFKESVNRKYIFTLLHSSGPFSRVAFWWATIGWIGRQVLSLQFYKAAGMLVGFCSHTRFYDPVT